MQIILGAKYRDIVTGFVGTCTGHVRYLTGCNQSLLIPPAEASSKVPDAHWFDDQRLERVGDSVVSLDNSQTPGPDLPAPIR